MVVSSPQQSPALSQLSSSSDKENSGVKDDGNMFVEKKYLNDSEKYLLDKENSAVKDDSNVFFEKDIERVRTEESKVVNTLPRVLKKVSFNTNSVEEEFEASRNSIESVDNPEEFIEGAESLMNLRNLELNHRSSVVGNQEVYRLPTSKVQPSSQQPGHNKDGSSLTFKEKLKLFKNQ